MYDLDWLERIQRISNKLLKDDCIFKIDSAINKLIAQNAETVIELSGLRLISVEDVLR